MASQPLDGMEVRPCFQEVRGKRMSEAVNTPGFGNPCARFGGREHAVRRHGGAGLGARVIGKEPHGGAIGAPRGPELRQQARSQRDRAIFLPFALLDAETHSLPVNVGEFEMEDLAHAEPRTGGRLEEGAMAQSGRGDKELRHLGQAQNHGEFRGLLGTGNVEGRRGAAECHRREEP
jgi:hypothetical protein